MKNETLLQDELINILPMQPKNIDRIRQLEIVLSDHISIDGTDFLTTGSEIKE